MRKSITWFLLPNTQTDDDMDEQFTVLYSYIVFIMYKGSMKENK